MKQPNRKTKKRRLKDIHTIAKGYKSPFLRDLLHQPKEDLVLTLMLRRIKVLPLGLGEEVVEDSLDFLFEVPGIARFRVNAFNHNRGAGGVFRTIPSKFLSMDELGMGKTFRSISETPRGSSR